MLRLITAALVAGSLEFVAGCGYTPVVIVDAADVPRGQRDAILILPGFGGRFEGTGWQEAWFSRKGYDLFIPDYIARGSIAACVRNLDDFIRVNRLGEYRRVCVFAYIVGGWALNEWIRAHPRNNIAAIVYDRSPLQERAAQVMTTDLPAIAWMLFGPVMWEMSKGAGVALERKDIRVGLLIESKATALIRNHRKTALAPGEVRWDAASLGQDFDDLLYVRLDHNEMYRRFETIGPEIFRFFRAGRFSPAARRQPFDEDPFEGE